MNANHTPGHWTVSKLASPEHSPQFGIYAGDDCNALAIVRGENASNDAALIAVAPRLLEALEWATDFAEGSLDIQPKLKNKVFISHLRECRQAIQEAKGGAQ